MLKTKNNLDFYELKKLNLAQNSKPSVSSVSLW